MCTDDNFHPDARLHFSELPIKGQVYVVCATAFLPGFGIGIFLIGITGSFNFAWNIEHGFRACRFRLVSELGHPPIQIAEPAELPV